MKCVGFLSLVGLVVVTPLVQSHSWIECTDYRMTPGAPNTRVWDPSQCFGRPRCSQRQMKEGFGVDTGLNFQSKVGCQCQRSQESYAQVPKAVYTPGQRVCLAYPPKNHVAAECTNPFIPDAGMIIQRTAINPTSDDTFVRSYDHLNGKHVDGTIDYKGFQNCPNFCQDKEHALCTMCFQLENDIASGEYTFKWIWGFNSMDDAYSTCWEARVEAGNGPVPNPSPVPTPAPSSVPTPVPTPVPSTVPIPVPSSVPSSVPIPVPSSVPTPTSAPVPPPSDGSSCSGSREEDDEDDDDSASDCENGPDVPVSYTYEEFDGPAQQNAAVQAYPAY